MTYKLAGIKGRECGRILNRLLLAATMALASIFMNGGFRAEAATQTIYQAEKAVLSGAKISGSVVVLRDLSWDSIQWTVQSGASGSANLQFRYAMPKPETYLELSVNNVVVAAKLKFKRTAAWDRFLMTSFRVNLPEGTSTIKLKEINLGGLAVDYMSVSSSSSTPATNLAPVVSAGADATVTLSANNMASTNLVGTASDDGKPAGYTLSKTWSQKQGPGIVQFADKSLLSTKATFTVAGNYILTLTASDGPASAGGLASSDDVLVKVNPRTVPPPASGANWMMVCQPDTQHLASSNPDAFKKQTSWIAGNHQLKNIRHIFHLGDMVNNSAKDEQWNAAVSAMNNLSPILGDVAISLTIGNHDFDTRFNNNSNVSKWASRFGHNYRKSYLWYGGTIDTMAKNDRDHYCIFTAGGYTFLSIDLQWNPRTSDLVWAKSILAQYPKLPTIVGTHAYLNDAGGLSIAGIGQTIWDNLVNNHPQIFLVVNGHSSASGSGSRYKISTNKAGKTVIQMLADFQAESPRVNWIKLLTFEMSQNRIHFQTYNPANNSFIKTGIQDHYESINFAERFNL